MHLKTLCYAVGITTHIVSVTTLPIAGPNKRELDGVFARSPEDIVPVEECKRALRAAPIFDEALYRRCAGEGEGEEESGAESDSDEDSNGVPGGDDNDEADAENIQLASNSPRQDCILTQMGLFPMPNFGLCEFRYASNTKSCASCYAGSGPCYSGTATGTSTSPSLSPGT